CGSLPDTCAGTPLWDDKHVYVTGGFPEKVILAIRADGSGDVTDTHVVWRTTTNAPYVPTPLLLGDKMYVPTDNGVFASPSTADGKTLWRTRLSGDVSASPIWAGGRIYARTEDGTVVVLSPDNSDKPLAENKLATGGMSTPAFSGDRIYLRTDEHLYCLGP